MSKKVEGNIEVTQKFLVQHGDYDQRYFETLGEAEKSAQSRTFSKGEPVLVYQAVAKAMPNVADVKIEKLV